MKLPKYALLAALLYGFSSVPAVATDVEPNNTTANAEVLQFDGSPIQVDGTIGPAPIPATADADYVDIYALDVKANDVLTFDMVCAYRCSTTGTDVDTRLTIVDKLDMSIWKDNDDRNYPVNNDPLIQDVSLGHDGTIYILVTQTGSVIDDPLVNIGYNSDPGGSGPYQLSITCTDVDGNACGSTPAPPPADPVPPESSTGESIINVNINPFYKGRWPRINPRSRGMLPVAILSRDGFDPADIVQNTLRFGANGDEDSLVRCREMHRDLNRDGVADLLCYFSMKKAGFDWHSENGILTGSLEDGTGITSEAPLKMVPYKRHHHGNRFGRSRRHH